MSVRSRFPFLLLSVTASCLCLERGESVARLADAEEVIERFSIPKDSHWILLPVTIKEKRYRFVLDTGACCTIYDKPLWSLLGKTKALKITEENKTVPCFDPPDARLGNLTLPKDSLVVGSDMKELRENFEEDIHGILGMDFLKRHILRMDFDRDEIVFLRKVGPDPGQRLAVTLKDVPYVRINLPRLEEPEEFTLDTGFARGIGGGDGGCLRKATFEALIKSGNLIPGGNYRFVGLAGGQMKGYGWLDSFPFAGNTHKNLSFTEKEYSSLGLDVLSRYVVTFDFPHQSIYLKKGRKFDMPYRYNRSGLNVRRVKGQTVVASVADGSAAARAGILPGDVLVQIDKEQINGMTLYTLRDQLCVESKNIVLTVRREAKQFDVPVALSPGR